MKCFAGTAWYGLVRRARRRGWIYRAVLIGPWHGMAAEASDDLQHWRGSGSAHFKPRIFPPIYDPKTRGIFHFSGFESWFRSYLCLSAVSTARCALFAQPRLEASGVSSGSFSIVRFSITCAGA